MYDYSQENTQQLMQEAVDMAIMDSACTKTGCMWRDICLESLSKEERKKIKYYPGGTNFKFGKETKIRSTEKLGIPCNICESIVHFKRDCPHALKNKRDSVLQTTDIEEDVNKVYDYSQDNKQQLMQEAADIAIMDSACTKTGCMWRDICLESLSKEERNKIKYYPSGTNYKFGGETKIRSTEKLGIPCNIAGKKTTILVDVVDSDIPLLLSKPNMQHLGFRLNMENKTFEVYGRVIELDTTSSGH